MIWWQMLLDLLVLQWELAKTIFSNSTWKIKIRINVRILLTAGVPVTNLAALTNWLNMSMLGVLITLKK